MKNNELEKLIDEILNNLKSNDEIRSDELPNIDLYMDQVLTYMDDHIGMYKRDPNDKILTKTMINNYSKSGILPPSNKKKYSKEHMILLTMIYFLKQTLSISDIKKLLSPLYEITNDNEEIDIFEFFDTVTNRDTDYFTDFLEQINQTIALSQSMFETETTDSKLSIITTAYLLSIQASIYKHIAAKLIDEFLPEEPNKKPTKK